MYLRYGFIGLITGFILGIFTIKLKNSNLYQKKISQKNTFKNNTKQPNEYQKELNNFFNQNIYLLDILANNYQTLYQHVLKSSKIFITNQNTNKITDNFKHDTYRYDNITTNQFVTKVPRDYPENKDTHK